MKRVLAFALIFLLAMGGALAEAGAGWRLDAHSLVVTVGEERFAPDLSYELEALAEGSVLYAESAAVSYTHLISVFIIIPPSH